jgi:hypothetical protein
MGQTVLELAEADGGRLGGGYTPDDPRLETIAPGNQGQLTSGCFRNP